MNYNDFAETVKAKYPEYRDVENRLLAEKVVAKYPEYKDTVEFEEVAATPPSEAPGILKSGALGLMSGIPGAESAISGIQAISPDKTYEEAHQGLEAAKDAAWEAHPVAYGTGKTAGIVGTGLAAPASIPGAIGIGALAGLDTASKLSDMPEEAAKGAAVGGVFGAVGEKIISPAINTVVNKIAPSLGKRAVASLGKPTLQDVESYLKNPEAIRTALTAPQMGEKLASVTGDVSKASSQLSGEARSLLNPENSPLSIRNLKDLAMKSVEKYGVEGNPATAADETAVKAIVEQYQKLANIAEANGGRVPENTLRSMIDRMQAATKESTFGNPEASAAQTAIRDFSGKLNESLRAANPEYAGAMKPAAELAELSSGIQKKFSLDPGATEATNVKMGNVLKESKTESQDLLEKLKEQTGIDFLDIARKAKTREAFEAGGSGQGINVLSHAAGYGAGALTQLPGGRLIGSLVGGMIGHNLDGGMIAKRILDTYISGSEAFSNSALKPVLAKFGPVLINAAKAGGNQLAATHYVLSTSDPEYQSLVQNMQDSIPEGQ